MAASSSASSQSLGLLLRVQQRVLSWTVRASRDSPRAAEALGQLLGPLQYPLLRASLAREAKSLAQLEAFLRPVLVPGEDGAAIAHWHHNNHLRAFARKEFLKRRAAAGEGAKMMKKVEEEGRLPSFQEVVEAFGLQEWNRVLGSDLREEDKRAELLARLVQARPTRHNHNNKAGGGGGGGGGGGVDVSGWSLEEVLEAGGACVWGRNGFNVWCEEEGRWDVLTREYVEGLGSYLCRRCEDMEGRGVANARVVLEVGAGAGQLARHLAPLLQDKGGITYHATDRAPITTTSSTAKGRIEVIKCDYCKALERFQPSLVLCQWMPLEEDFTGEIRATPGVEEYVLIGEADSSCCGDAWLTWGQQPPQHPQHARRGGSSKPKPPYVLDGFERVDLHELSAYQLSRYDCREFARNSTTVAFTRRGHAPPTTATAAGGGGEGQQQKLPGQQ